VGFALFLLLSTWRWIYPNTRTHIQAQGGLPYQEKSISVISSISGTLGEEQLYYFYIDNSSHELNNSHSPVFIFVLFTLGQRKATHIGRCGVYCYPSRRRGVAVVVVVLIDRVAVAIIVPGGFCSSWLF
jgi:hypothetical protein